MSGSNSSPQNTTATTTNASETNLAATNTQGVTLVGNKGNTSLSTTSVTTDLGAVQAGTELGQKAISSNTGLTESVASGSFDFANHALDVISQGQTESASIVGNALDFGANLLQQESNANAALTQQTASVLGNIATANDTTQASQSTAFASNALKVGAVVVLGVVLLVVFVGNRK